jgi:hypothetical protein
MIGYGRRCSAIRIVSAFAVLPTANPRAAADELERAPHPSPEAEDKLILHKGDCPRDLAGPI